jgi:uncharacterized damage-inducible protein DinB
MTLGIQERPNLTESPVAPSSGLDRLLDEFESLLLLIPPAAYETIPKGGGVTIARHVVRSLDLIDALVAGGSARVIAYQSGQATPIDLPASLRRIRALRRSLVNWPGRSLDGVIRVEQMGLPLGLVERGWSTLANELGFVVNHVVDMQRVIERMLQSSGLCVPEGFGSMELQPLRARSSVPPSWALWRLLDDLESLLSEVAPDVYCARFATDVSGSIGEHVRHCLDHVSALLAADSSTTLSYDRRHRGTAVETDPAEALRQILQLKRALDVWSTRSLDEPIRVTSMISPSGDAVTGWSTLARELAFVVSHTIHHQAIIGVLLAINGHAVPERFGHSPSTPRQH